MNTSVQMHLLFMQKHAANRNVFGHLYLPMHTDSQILQIVF